mmetsp:Transcript_7232/g.12175  ORF Transcript_7232/g.12175 Transcript_7232/m.12175 type:complete len:309 (+) Transcript_7232:236-1162(+)
MSKRDPASHRHRQRWNRPCEWACRPLHCHPAAAAAIVAPPPEPAGDVDCRHIPVVAQPHVPNLGRADDPSVLPGDQSGHLFGRETFCTGGHDCGNPAFNKGADDVYVPVRELIGQQSIVAGMSHEQHVRLCPGPIAQDVIKPRRSEEGVDPRHDDAAGRRVPCSPTVRLHGEHGAPHAPNPEQVGVPFIVGAFSVLCTTRALLPAAHSAVRRDKLRRQARAIVEPQEGAQTALRDVAHDPAYQPRVAAGRCAVVVGKEQSLRAKRLDDVSTQRQKDEVKPRVMGRAHKAVRDDRNGRGARIRVRARCG